MIRTKFLLALLLSVGLGLVFCPSPLMVTIAVLSFVLCYLKIFYTFVERK